MVVPLILGYFFAFQAMAVFIIMPANLQNNLNYFHENALHKAILHLNKGSTPNGLNYASTIGWSDTGSNAG
jgi:uncharacterized membrane protein